MFDFDYPFSLVLATHSIGELVDEPENIKTNPRISTSLNQYCKTKDLSKRQVRNSHILHIKKKNLVFCTVPKVASSNWRRVFLYFEEIVTDPTIIQNFTLGQGEKDDITMLIHKTKFDHFGAKMVRNLATGTVLHIRFKQR